MGAQADRSCPREDSNLHAVSGTGPSNQPVYQFQHVGELPRACRPDRTAYARRGTRTLTRLPPQDPESCASANSAIRADPAASDGSGAEGSRTPDLLNAIQALSQLSYSPVLPSRVRCAAAPRCRHCRAAAALILPPVRRVERCVAPAIPRSGTNAPLREPDPNCQELTAQRG